jgi:mRNA-degrading endonuclease RelE of RelBE toxin-antitoxin system
MRLLKPTPVSNYASTIGDEIVLFGTLQSQWGRVLTEISLKQDTDEQNHQNQSLKLKPRMSIARATLPEHGVHQHREKRHGTPRHQTPIPRNWGDSTLNSAPISSEPEDRRPPPWYVAFTSQFKKDLSGLDRRLMGRVLEKISEITEDPCRAIGDTIKPLGGEKKGFWRARIGDFRLVYFPDLEMGNISIHTLASRGSVYE